ncbi:YjjI family glycine radical enzyme [Cetobacterium sp. 2A]|uniref:YjjI family glycine radical enzyme n=1 Tax=unclassified Cetobacterium TaxID=2630983 RepID=UPI00163CA3A6|nr:YjjI family glycine radical enzyme [Cetobacterium sp. 2A]MBC2854983.1 YjjI family glycine radical enzyme [Cetobacterium sp. 2A]
MNDVLNIIKNSKITFEQKVVSLARYAENSIEVLNVSDYIKKFKQDGIVCDLFEGNAPYRPRYIVPDYEKFMKNGSSFLNIQPATNLWEAIHNLLIFYKHVPSITTMPVYLGNIDYLLNPYTKDNDESYLAIKLFLKHIDSTITDSFCHANIGPVDTVAGRLILKAMRELQLPTPNLTIKYDDTTSDEFSIDAIQTALVTSKPSFANNNMFSKDFSGEYGIVSCYNGLKVGGGANTLVRIRLGKLSKLASCPEVFLNEVLPEAAKETLKYIDERSKFIIEESGFYSSNFLVKEGFLEKDKFTGLFGIVGLAECVNNLLNATDKNERFGHNEKANSLGLQIVQKLNEIIKEHKSPYAGDFFDNNHLFHSQVGIETDENESPGCRIPVNEEPELYDHIVQSSKFHEYFPSGIGDIFVFDETFKKNPDAILDIIKGSFSQNMRFFSLYGSDCDVIRVTGYLVKKSEMMKLDKGEVVLRDTTALGKGARDNGKALDRKLRK